MSKKIFKGIGKVAGIAAGTLFGGPLGGLAAAGLSGAFKKKKKAPVADALAPVDAAAPAPDKRLEKLRRQRGVGVPSTIIGSETGDTRLGG